MSTYNNEKMLARLNKLKKSLTGKNIYVLGHDNIDVDAFLSGVLLCRLLKFLCINAKFIVLQKIKQDDTYEIINKFIDIDMYSYEDQQEDDQRNLFLVDHYETTHSGNVIGCIDHHPTEKENTYEFSYVRNCCSSSYLIYELMEAAKYPINAEEATMIVISMMVDTTAFKSSKAIPEEIEVAKRLATSFKLDYFNMEKASLCLTPIDRMSIDEIISNGQKSYNFNGHHVKSAYLQLYGMPDEIIVDSWIKNLSKQNGLDMIVFIIFDLQSNKTYEYHIYHYYTDIIVHTGILSRGKDIMPRIEKSFL